MKRHPQLPTLNPKPSTLNPQPSTLNTQWQGGQRVHCGTMGFDDARAHEGAGRSYLAAPHTVLSNMFPPEIWSYSDQKCGCILSRNSVEVSDFDMSLRLLAGLTENALWENGFDGACAHEGAGRSYLAAPHTMLRSMLRPESWLYSDQKSGRGVRK